MTSDPGTNSKNVKLSVVNDEKADALINTLEQQLEYYELKNNQYEETLLKLKLVPDSLSRSSRNILTKLTELQEASLINKLDPIDYGMSYLNNATARFKYKTDRERLKEHFDELIRMNASLQSEIKNIEKETFLAKCMTEDYLSSSNQLQKIRHQIKFYEEKLLHYIKKYPWLNKPEYNLLSIQEQIMKLYHMRHRIEKVQSKMNIYYGLKPDLITAKNQMSKIKIEYEKISKILLDLECRHLY